MDDFSIISLKHFQLLGITIPGQAAHKPKTNPGKNKNKSFILKENKEPKKNSIKLMLINNRRKYQQNDYISPIFINTILFIKSNLRWGRGVRII